MQTDALTYQLPPPLMNTYDQREQRRVADELLATATEASQDFKSKRNVIVHAYSVNGYVAYQHIQAALADHPRLALAGTIIDSAPVPWTVASLLFRPKFSQLAVKQLPNQHVPPIIYAYLILQEEKPALSTLLRKYLAVRREFSRNWAKHSSDHA